MTWETFFQVLILVIILTGAILLILAGIQTAQDSKSKRQIERLRAEYEMRNRDSDG